MNFNENDLWRNETELLNLMLSKQPSAKVLLKLEFDTEDQVLFGDIVWYYQTHFLSLRFWSWELWQADREGSFCSLTRYWHISPVSILIIFILRKMDALELDLKTRSSPKHHLAVYAPLSPWNYLSKFTNLTWNGSYDLHF